MKCSQCGIAELQGETTIYCFKFKRLVKDDESNRCLYFTRVIYEEGERLSPSQCLALKEADLRSKKLKGPMS